VASSGHTICSGSPALETELIAVDQDRFRISRWLILPAGLVVALLSATFSYTVQVWINPEVVRHPLGQFAWVFLFNLLTWTSWLALVPIVLWLSRTNRFTRGSRLRPLLVHGVAALALATLHCLFSGTVRWAIIHLSAVEPLTDSTGSWLSAVKFVALFSFEWEVMLYGGLVAMDHAVRFSRELQERAVSESRLQARLVEAQLEALQRQLHPHFLFNTLHAIATLLHTDPNAAEAMIVRLGDLLRAVFRSHVQQEVSVAREIQLLEQYLAIQRLRFGGGLEADIRVDKDAAGLRVPVLVLQPLVENAIKHGLARGRGRISVTVCRIIGDRLAITVSDNGKGVGSHELRSLNEGIGLSNTRARLEHLYPGEHHVSFATPPGGGFGVTLTLPSRAAVDELPAELRVPA
jgi:two-component sensor histidine kinase